MERKPLLKRLLAGVLSLSVAVSGLTFAMSADYENGSEGALKKVSNDLVSAALPGREQMPTTEEALYADSDRVRVSIVLDGKSTIESGYKAENIAQNAAAMSYRSSLQAKQDNIVAKIEKTLGEDLDVVWNLTLAANLISANVEYGQIGAIKSIKGIKEVVVETQYFPDVIAEKLEVNPNMATSGTQIGSNLAWAAGYTGAGSRIAVIDTGTDTNHQSFSEAGYLYSLEVNAKEKGMTVEEYTKSLNLLTAEEINSVKDKLNAAEGGIDLDKAYLNAKLPFVYNYIDDDYDVTHDNDSQTEHGSHVAGIATANAWIKTENGFEKALDSVFVQGVAPDAQLITMKVFGKNGGAYDSDYMAAIEDAIILKADSINLSLGSEDPGRSKCLQSIYQTIMDNLSKSGVVVSMSAGNAGTWVENADNLTGHLYIDDISMQTNGSPGSYTNSLSVASVDNIGSTGTYLSAADGSAIFYTESPSEDGYASITTLKGEQSYILIDGTGTYADWSALREVLEGKIAICQRGDINFVDKANLAVGFGAIATVIYNNTTGTLNMSADGYMYDKPYVFITKADGAVLKKNAKEKTLGEGESAVVYYEGTLVSNDKPAVVMGDPDADYVMSDFSSWGVPGSLQLKPEITAPGGNIYSVNGLPEDGTAYENMSGTSMASPQIAGMAAVVAQYVREKGLNEKINPRTLIQSLLMSTAEPIVEYTDDKGQAHYYSLLSQGAGIAKVYKAVSAESYILMGSDAGISAEDGKVKAELGDDPDRKGVYTFSFSVNNITDTPVTYTLNANMFTQDYFEDAANEYGDLALYMDTATAPLDCNAEFTANGARVTQVTVPANGSQTVTVTLTLSDKEKKNLDNYYKCGAYIEGYVWVKPATTEEGVDGVVHSIPVLGFYGNWTDASMFDVGSYIEAVDQSDNGEYRIPYLGDPYINAFSVKHSAESNAYLFGGNPVLREKYDPNRNAINGNDIISAVSYAPIRNGEASRFILSSSSLTEPFVKDYYTVETAYYSTNHGEWESTSSSKSIDVTPYGLGLKEGDVFDIAFEAAPEYYVDEKGNVAWDKLGDGASLSIKHITIDSTYPEILDYKYDSKGKTLTISAYDNQYIAGVMLFNRTGDYLLSYTLSDAEKPGEKQSFVFDISELKGTQYVLQVADYADNTATYVLDLVLGEDIPVPEIMGFNSESDGGSWYSLNNEGNAKKPVWYAGNGSAYTAAAMVDDIVFAIDEESNFYCMSIDDPDNKTWIAQLSFTASDMAYNPTDGRLYCLSSSTMYAIDKLSGRTLDAYYLNTTSFDEFGFLDFYSPKTLACDNNGLFYFNAHDTNDVYGFALLKGYNDIDPVKLYSVDAIGGTMYGQAMEIDLNSGLLVWTGAYSENFESHPFYMVIEPESGEVVEYCDLDVQLQALVIPDKREKNYDFNGDGKTDENDVQALLDYRMGKIEDIGCKEFADLNGDNEIDTYDAYLAADRILWSKPASAATYVSISDKAVELFVGGTKDLDAIVYPFTLNDRSIVWSSSDNSVATVDKDGLVKATGAGSCFIYASSAVTSEVFAACEVRADNIEVTLYGALEDSNGAQLYEWNMENDSKWTSVAPLELTGTIGASTATKNYVYITTSDNRINIIDPLTGKVLESGPVDDHDNTGSHFKDLAYSCLPTHDTDVITGVYDASLCIPLEPLDIMLHGFDCSDMLMDGATDLIAIANLGETIFMDWLTGEFYDGEKYMAVDNTGRIWYFEYMEKDDNSSTLMTFILRDFAFPEGTLGTNTKGEHCSMVQGEDGYIYLAAYDNNVYHLYRLNFVSEEFKTYSTYMCDVTGTDAMTIYNVTGNYDAPASAANTAYIDAVCTNITRDANTGEVSFDSKYVPASAFRFAETNDFEGDFDFGDSDFDFGDDNDDSLDDEINEYIEVDYNNITISSLESYLLDGKSNGLFILNYDADYLMLTENNISASDNVFTSVKIDNENGKAILAYACRAIPENPVDFAVSFTAKSDNIPSCSATIIPGEVGDINFIPSDIAIADYDPEVSDLSEDASAYGYTKNDVLALSRTVSLEAPPVEPTPPVVSEDSSDTADTDTTPPTEESTSASDITVSQDNTSSSAGNPDDNNGGDDNMNTGVVFCLAPTAVSVIALLASKKRRK